MLPLLIDHQKEPSSARKPTKTKVQATVTEDRTIPVWLQATESLHRKLNQVATECGLTRYDTLSRGPDALCSRHGNLVPFNKKIKGENQGESFRKTMGQASRKYWATLTPKQKRARAQKSAGAAE